jgi:hypothetical protein
MACPTCGGPLQALEGPDAALGFCLFRPENAPPSLPKAAAVAMPILDPSMPKPADAGHLE